MPRPKKSPASIANRYVSFRLNEADYEALAAVAGRAGLRVNELARRLARRGGHRIVIQTSRRHDPAFIAQIRAMGLNLNQLIHNAHIFGRVSPRVAEVCDEIRRVVLTAAEEGGER